MLTTDAIKVTEAAGRMIVAGRRRPPVSSDTIVVSVMTTLACAGLAGWLSRGSALRSARERDAVATCADRLRQGSAVLGASVLVDSALEHFRGNYENRLMYVPPLLSAATIATAFARPLARLRAALSGTDAAVGTAGLALHAYNILKRPGGLSWNNLFYAAPIAAPGALALSGLLGLAADRLEAHRRRHGTTRTRRRMGRMMAFGLSGGIAATVAEVALLHFRGAFHNPAMYAPLVLPPAAAASLVAVAARPSKTGLELSRVLLSATAALGAIGTVFHAYGVQRNMGGWHNWTQNLFSGPPLPAPPSFTGLAIAGLGVLRLIDQRD